MMMPIQTGLCDQKIPKPLLTILRTKNGIKTSYCLNLRGFKNFPKIPLVQMPPTVSWESLSRVVKKEYIPLQSSNSQWLLHIESCQNALGISKVKIHRAYKKNYLGRLILKTSLRKQYSELFTKYARWAENKSRPIIDKRTFTRFVKHGPFFADRTVLFFTHKGRIVFAKYKDRTLKRLVVQGAIPFASGSFGSTYSGVSILKPEKRMIFKIADAIIEDDQIFSVQQIRNEAEILQRIYQSGASTTGIQVPPKGVYLYGRLGNEGGYITARYETDLNNQIISGSFRRYTLKKKIIAMVQIALGVKNIHTIQLEGELIAGISHGDIKPENILSWRENGKKHYVLCDFGGAATYSQLIERSKANIQDILSISTWEFTSYEDFYKSRRLFRGGYFETLHQLILAHDIYSLGITFYTMLAEANPRYGVVNKKVDKPYAASLRFSDEVLDETVYPCELISLIKRMTDASWLKRPSITDVQKTLKAILLSNNAT